MFGTGCRLLYNSNISSIRIYGKPLRVGSFVIPRLIINILNNALGPTVVPFLQCINTFLPSHNFLDNKLPNSGKIRNNSFHDFEPIASLHSK